MALHQQLHPLAQLGQELRRPDHPGVLAQAQHPGDQLTRVGVGGDEHAVAVVPVGPEAAVAAEMALDLPGDALAYPDLGGADRVAELPMDPVSVAARVEIVRALEVVLGLGRVADLAADPGEPEDPDRVALVGPPDDVELAALEQQLVGIDAARAHLVAFHRVVVEDDRLAPEDRRLDLGQPLGDVMAAGRAGDPQRDRVLLRRAQRARAAPGDLLQSQPQRLGIGELPIEQLQRGAE